MHIVSINHNSPCGLYLTEQGLLYWVIESMAVIGNADLPKLAIQLQPDRASPAFSATRLHQVIFIEALFLGRPKCVFTNFGPKYPCGERSLRPASSWLMLSRRHTTFPSFASTACR